MFTIMNGLLYFKGHRVAIFNPEMPPHIKNEVSEELQNHETSGRSRVGRIEGIGLNESAETQAQFPGIAAG